MPLSTNRQAQIAFKNLVGKSQAQKNFGPGDELNGYFINISTNNVWSTPIPSNDPTKAVNDGVAIKKDNNRKGSFMGPSFKHELGLYI